MTPLDLRTQLITVLGTELGTYTSATGKKYPAIWITPPLIDPSYKVTGLQVVVFNSPEVAKQIPLTGEKLKRQWWTIEITQNDDKKSIARAVELVENFYPVCVSRVKPQTRNDYEQARISIYDPQFVGVSKGLKT